MFDELRRLSQHFLSYKNSIYRRYLIRSVSFSARMNIIVGPRGVGKTTTLVQALLDFVQGDRFDQRILYLQADHFLLGNSSLYEIAEQFHMYGGKWLAIDEVHRYPNWSVELKSIYDTFPDLKLLISGSSALEIHRGTHDLSRRAILYHMQGMSFREYLELIHGLSFSSYTLEEICGNHERIADVILQLLAEKELKVAPEFDRYIKYGYYPYYHEVGNDAAYSLTLEQTVHTTIETDLAAIYPHLTGHTLNKIKKLFIYFANSVPFIPNWNKIQEVLEIGDSRTLKSYFSHLQDAGLIRAIAKATAKFNKLESPSKVFLDNTNLLFAICSEAPETGNVRETYFLSMVSLRHEVELPTDGDFLVEGCFLFEVGGKKKTFKQIKSTQNSYLACDGMERGVGAKIPLWLFGFLY
jgi:predicted AAA+ superfamily ATPase